MKKWEYTATDNNGNTDHGIIKGNSFNDVLGQLLNKSLYPMDIKELSGASAFNYGQIAGLKRLKRKLEGKPAEEPELILIADEDEEESKSIDWTYVVFMAIFVLVIAAVTFL